MKIGVPLVVESYKEEQDSEELGTVECFLELTPEDIHLIRPVFDEELKILPQTVIELKEKPLQGENGPLLASKSYTIDIPFGEFHKWWFDLTKEEIHIYKKKK